MNLCNDRKQQLQPEVKIHQSEDELASNMAEYVLNISDAAISDHGAFAIAISENCVKRHIRKSSIGPNGTYFGQMSALLRKTMPIAITYKLAREGFFSKVPILHSHINPINDSLTAEQAAEDYEFLLRQLVKTRIINVSEVNDCPKFDLILLGMGPNGHVVPRSLVVPRERTMGDFYHRFAQASTRENHAYYTCHKFCFECCYCRVATGGNKAEAVRLAIGPEHLDFPARMVRPVTGNLVWFVDVESASKLDGAKFC